MQRGVHTVHWKQTGFEESDGVNRVQIITEKCFPCGHASWPLLQMCDIFGWTECPAQATCSCSFSLMGLMCLWWVPGLARVYYTWHALCMHHHCMAWLSCALFHAFEPSGHRTYTTLIDLVTTSPLHVQSCTTQQARLLPPGGRRDLRRPGALLPLGRPCLRHQGRHVRERGREEERGVDGQDQGHGEKHGFLALTCFPPGIYGNQRGCPLLQRASPAIPTVHKR